MRIKVVDITRSGDVECIAKGPYGDVGYTVSREPLLKSVCPDRNSWEITDDEAMKLLQNKEFTVRPVWDRFIPSAVKIETENYWTRHDVVCQGCGRIYCSCGDSYQPATY